MSPGGNSCRVIVPRNGSDAFGQGYLYVRRRRRVDDEEEEKVEEEEVR